MTQAVSVTPQRKKGNYHSREFFLQQRSVKRERLFCVCFSKRSTWKIPFFSATLLLIWRNIFSLTVAVSIAMAAFCQWCSSCYCHLQQVLGYFTAEGPDTLLEIFAPFCFGVCLGVLFTRRVKVPSNDLLENCRIQQAQTTDSRCTCSSVHTTLDVGVHEGVCVYNVQLLILDGVPTST